MEDATSSRHMAGLDSSCLKIVLNTSPKNSPTGIPPPFGTSFTDHMILVEWEHTSGWAQPRITPYGPLPLDPAACVLHYSSSCFEGMKAFRGKDEKIRLFRPKMNMARFNRSAERIALPTVDEDALLQIIWKLVEIDQHFIPCTRGHSLYLRPTMIATNADLAITMPKSALLFVIASPAGPYYHRGFQAIVLETASAVRAWPGGVGDRKVGSNYGPTIVPQQQAHLNGSDQNLWLIGEDERITEAGTMNFFALIKHKATDSVDLVTPDLDGTILAGITRDSVLHLARNKLAGPGFSVSERKLTMVELSSAADEGRLLEAFGTGTAAIVCPIRTIRWRSRILSCGLETSEEAGGIAKQMKQWIEDRQFGEEEHEWGVTMAT